MSIAHKYDLEIYTLEQAQQEDLQQLLDVCAQNIGTVNEDQITKAFKLCYLSHNGVTRV